VDGQGGQWFRVNPPPRRNCGAGRGPGAKAPARALVLRECGRDPKSTETKALHRTKKRECGRGPHGERQPAKPGNLPTPARNGRGPKDCGVRESDKRRQGVGRWEQPVVGPPSRTRRAGRANGWDRPRPAETCAKEHPPCGKTPNRGCERAVGARDRNPGAGRLGPGRRRASRPTRRPEGTAIKKRGARRNSVPARRPVESQGRCAEHAKIDY